MQSPMEDDIIDVLVTLTDQVDYQMQRKEARRSDKVTLSLTLTKEQWATLFALATLLNRMDSKPN